MPGRPDTVPARLKWDASKREVYAQRLFDSDLVCVLSELAVGLDKRQVTVSEGTAKLQTVLHAVAAKVFGTFRAQPNSVSGRKQVQELVCTLSCRVAPTTGCTWQQ